MKLLRYSVTLPAAERLTQGRQLSQFLSSSPLTGCERFQL